MSIVVSKETYFKSLKNFEQVPYTQTSGWCDYVACTKPDSTLFLMDSPSCPSIACQGQEKKRLGKKMLLVEGLCFRSQNISSKTIKAFLEEIIRLHYDMIELTLNQPYFPELEIGIRQAGFLRPVGCFLSSLSLWIDITTPVDYNQNWKRNLKRAHSLPLLFEPIESPTEKDRDQFLSMYSELQKDKGFSHRLTKKELSAMLCSTSFQLAFVKDSKGIPLSCILYHIVGTHAGLLYAAKSEAAKETGATFYMYEQLFAYLSQRGITCFDMEKLVPSTHSKNSVFLFKNGIKGRHVTYSGEWAWYKKSHYRPLLYFVKKYLMKKDEV